MNNARSFFFFAGCTVCLLGCRMITTLPEAGTPSSGLADGLDGGDRATETGSDRESPAAALPQDDSAGLLQPEDMEYLGAFRLPDSGGDYGWEWGGSASAFFPEGDPGGPEDAFPGSIYVTGNDQRQRIAEISIPIPVISKDMGVLNTAGLLQDFSPLLESLYGEMELPRAGLAFLSAPESQTAGKLFFVRAQHMGEGETKPLLGWAELNLDDSQPAGLWRIGEYWNYVTGDYLLEIPAEWAGSRLPGVRLAAGRFRDGGQGSEGPTLMAIGPWPEETPPPPGETLPAVPLLMYGSVYEENPPSLEGYHHSDEWSGAAWLTSDAGSAVIFAGTKGAGECWYGCSDGTVWPDEPPFPEACPDFNRGWWSTGFEGRILFYDPEDLAAVARGDLQPWEPQPYASLNPDSWLYHISSVQQKNHLGDVAFDREHGLLYVFEPFADGDKPVVHVLKIGAR